MSEKYPRTLHIPSSPGCSRDDKKIDSINLFLKTEIVITEKLDGSNVCLTSDTLYARSHSGTPTHPSFSWLKKEHALLKNLIEPGYSVFGEYCYAVHSIQYHFLPGYLMVFGVREDTNDVWLSWEDTKDFATFLGLPIVPVLFQGIFTQEKYLQSRIDNFMSLPSEYGPEREGVVIRGHGSFFGHSFSENVAKYVRANHITSDEHWIDQPITRQGLMIG